LHELFDHEEMSPLVLQLLEDRDLHVRHYAVTATTKFKKLHTESVLPILQRQLYECEPGYQLRLLEAICAIRKDKEVISLLLRTLTELDVPPVPSSSPSSISDYVGVLILLQDVYQESPEFFPDSITVGRNLRSAISCFAMDEMAKFGKKGIPILVRGLNDRNPWVRESAADALSKMGSDAYPAVPWLEHRISDNHPDVQKKVVRALQAIDPIRLQRLQAKREIE
jgi:HEAT repeat protein